MAEFRFRNGVWSSDLDYYLQLLVNGSIAGSVYALAAIGFAMTYGVLRVVNFAFGATCVAGGYTGFVCVIILGWPGWLAMIASAAVGAIFGVTIEQVAFRPFRNRSPLLAMAASLACAIIMENSIAAIFGNDVRTYRSRVVSPASYHVAGAVAGSAQILTALVSIILLALVYLYIRKTRMGWETVSVTDDADAAATWGVNRERIILMNFALGSALAGMAGFLIGLDLDVEPYMGTEIVFKAFTANLIFGLGSLPGAAAGGLLLGVLENLIAGLVSSRFKSAYTFVVLVSVLAVRPRGILNLRARRFEV